MDVKFKITSSNYLADLPVTDGQLIVLKDTDAMYYDMSGVRHSCKTEGDDILKTTNTQDSSIIELLEDSSILVDGPQNQIAVTKPTQTLNGITITNKGDYTYTASGVSTSATYLNLTGHLKFKKGTYTLSGTETKTRSSCFLYVYNYTKREVLRYENVNNGTFVIDDSNVTDEFNINISVTQGYDCSNTTFKPCVVKGAVNRGFVPPSYKITAENANSTSQYNSLIVTPNTQMPILLKGYATKTRVYTETGANLSVTYPGTASGTQLMSDITHSEDHLSDTSNPHSVTKEQVGLGNVENTSDFDKPISSSMQAALDTKVDKVAGKSLSTNDLTATLKYNYDTAYSHISSTNNPHQVTKAQVELGNCDNTSDMDKPVSIAQQNAINESVDNLAVNLINVTAPTQTSQGVTYTNNGDGSISVNGMTTTEWNNHIKLYVVIVEGETYTLSCGFGDCTQPLNLYVQQPTDIVPTNVGNTAITNTSIEKWYTFTALKSGTIILRAGVNETGAVGITVTNGIIYPMLEVGNVKHEFQPYIGADSIPKAVYELENNPCFKGTLSQNRLAGSTVGENSSTLGLDCTASGYSSHSEGYKTIANENSAHAEGAYTTASGEDSHAEGYGTTASGDFSHAEGSTTTASGGNSHVEGDHTTASGTDSHAEGSLTTATGYSSHTEGLQTKANGYSSHAEGFSTIATGDFSHVQGKYNVEDTSGTYAHIIGGGTSVDARKNIHTVDWNGNAVYAGTVKATSYSTFKDVAPTLIPINGSTANYTATQTDRNWYYVRNGICYVSISLGCVSAVAVNHGVIISSAILPAPVDRGAEGNTNWAHSITNPTATPLVVEVCGNDYSASGGAHIGQIVCTWGQTGVSYYQIRFCYPVAD